MKNEEQAASSKKRVGIAAAQLVPDGAVVGLGTGSTAKHTIEELGRRMREENFHCVGIPTSYQATILARKESIPLVGLDEVMEIDVAIDGADEVDPLKNLIKGGGAAHTHEKIVDSLAKQFIVVVDDSKLVDRLGSEWPVPIEVLSFALAPVMRKLKEMGAEPELRMALKKDGPVITDEGNLIIDARFPSIDNPAKLECELNNIPGVLENGIFSNMANIVLTAPRDGGAIRRME